MRFACFLSITAILCVCCPTHADKPATPTTRTEVVAGGKYLFVMLCHPAIETDAGKAIRAKYPKAGLYKNDGSREPLWTIDWYAEQVAIASDGVHMVRYGPWPGRIGKFNKNLKNQLIPKEALEKEAVSFFANGKLLKEFKISELVDDRTKLPASVSHFRWLKSSAFFDDKLQFDAVTFDGNGFRFDVKAGKIIEKRRVD